MIFIIYHVFNPENYISHIFIIIFLIKLKGTMNQDSIKKYRLKTNKVVPPEQVDHVGTLQSVSKRNFPVLNGVTNAIIEMYDKSMRLPHWHPNANEIGYVVSGKIEVYLWLSFGESSIFTVSSGGIWFVPRGALHSINNIGDENAKLLVGFDTDLPETTDLPVAYNGIPIEIRAAYTNPHSELIKYVGTIKNPILGKYKSIQCEDIPSPYRADFNAITPLFDNPCIGSVIWAVKDNWNILKGISIIKILLKPHAIRDAVWYPDAAILYIVTKGKAKFNIVKAGTEPTPFVVKLNDYIFIPAGVLHDFINVCNDDFEVIGLFSKDNPLPEVSLATSSNFFPHRLLNDALTRYGDRNGHGHPLSELKDFKRTPYLFKSD